MLLEHQAAMKLARKLAQKIGAEPEKFGEMARKAAQAPEGLACGLNYGPIPLGAAGKALNFMHWAVNGVRPYPEEGGGELDSRDCERGYGDSCIRSGVFNPCDCTEHNGFTGLIAGVCVSPDIFTCGTPSAPKIFKCPSGFTCGSGGEERSTFGGCVDWYCQCDDGNCPNEHENFECPHFTCSGGEGRSSFDCKAPGQHGSFGCTSSGTDFNCAVEFGCVEAGFTCNAATFQCQGDFDCSNNEMYECSNVFICHLGPAFDCMDDPFTCSGHFQCMPLTAFGDDQCYQTFNCDAEAFDCEPAPLGPYNCSESYAEKSEGQSVFKERSDEE